MIERDHGSFTLVCDCCQDCADESFRSFEEAVEAKKELGWKSKKVDGEWQDLCPSCGGY